MNIQTSHIALFVLFTAFACGKQIPGFNTYDAEFERTLAIDRDYRMTLIDVVEQRCPQADTCASDQVVVTFEVSAPSDTITFDLHFGNDRMGPSDTTIFDIYFLEVLEVLPLPREGQEFEESEYIARTLVQKLID